MMDELTLVQKIVVWVIPVIFAITVHEVAHGWVAKQYGDKTAWMLGRLTLNPLKHIDPVGTILVPGLMLAFTGFVFGWAKPVPVNIRNLRNPKHDMAIVALAGPAANFLMALGWALFARLGVLINTPEFSIPMIYVGIAGIMINLILGLLNLLPIPPLDGSRILSWILPGRLSLYYDQFEKYGFYLLVLLLMTDSLGVVLGYPLSIAKGFFFSIAGL
ncbi:site-2 protease family protein [methanotrophic endosymbiont of Bathymodiolus puteoserpentis (Logatchev)]|uniref:site-2 protease family protein n=1 Tax=methanotrophic endosymbiont of Bathymodiolus puteoserpentis (Logatchev) TaxID=343235 RepID=UPI00157B7EE3|nr:site-2 protease family protein [methanotrophic endosymbiont of Bathymodiolus puteoserpentis (Logatchev)]